jgi:AcrR family transcriptional regulator
MPKTSFKQQVLKAREEAIVAAASRFLAQKDFDSMTMDEVAAEAGIAKASLYKHFPSKESLAAAAMVCIMERALTFIRCITPQGEVTGERAAALIREVLCWVMRVQLADEMPSLPAQNSSLRAVLLAHPPYMECLMGISEVLGAWIQAAQEGGHLQPKLPAEVILYLIFAKACDPVLTLMKVSGNYEDGQIVEILSQVCFSGLAGPTMPTLAG